MKLCVDPLNSECAQLLDNRITEKPVAHILWTGGWDSTFRIVSLAKKDVIVQPYYLSDNRRSEFHELNAIKVITDELKKMDSTKCVFRPLKTMDVKDIPEDKEITDSYKKLREKMFMGSQYDWLARFAEVNKGLELCIHKDDKALEIIMTLGNAKKVQDEVGAYYLLDDTRSPIELIKVFGNFHFPILDMSKLDMKKIAEELGYQSIMSNTWFCHSPINNEPCGVCNPCKYTIEEGMEYRFSEKALKRYKTDKQIEKLIFSRYIRSIRRRVVGY